MLEAIFPQHETVNIPLKASELNANGVDTGPAGELWRPLSDDGTGDDVRPSGNRGEVPRTDDCEGGTSGVLAGLFLAEARGVDCCAEDWRVVRRFAGEDMTNFEGIGIEKLELGLSVYFVRRWW